MSSLRIFIPGFTVNFAPAVIGFGVYPLLAFILALIILTTPHWNVRPFLKNARHIWSQPRFLILFALLVSFGCCYRGLYTPYHPTALHTPWGYFWVLFALSALIMICITCLDKNRELVYFIWYFCLGALFFCLVTVGLTVLLGNPPFYSRALDVRYLFLGRMEYINTPGIANLLCLFPVTFLAGTILNSNQRPKWFWPIGIAGFIFSLIAGLAIGQRSYFIICFLIAPIIVSFFLTLLGTWRPSLALITLLLTYPILLKIDEMLGTGLLHRPIRANLLNDPRFQMFQFWIDHLMVDPFQRVEVGPPPWDSLQWFHNFFADIHRLSGFWALLSAVILVTYIFYRVLCVISKKRRIGLFLMAVAIPNFLIMNTSVVPEGERQPFLLLLAIGAISEVILANLKHASGTKLHNDPLNSNPK